MSGGSTASNMVMSNLNNISITNTFVKGFKVEGDINSLNTYQPSGGARRNLVNLVNLAI